MIMRAVYTTALILVCYFTLKVIFRLFFNYYLIEISRSTWVKIFQDLLVIIVVIAIFGLSKTLVKKSRFLDYKIFILFAYSLLLIFLSFLLLYFFNAWEIDVFPINFQQKTLAFLFLFLSALNEELMFRFVIFETLKRKKLSDLFVLIFSSVLFSLAHLFNPNINLLSLISILIGGFLLGFIYLEQKNIWHTVSFHLGWNFSQVLLLNNISEVQFLDDAKLISISNSSTLLSSGIEGSLECVILLTIFSFFYIKHHNRKLELI